MEMTFGDDMEEEIDACMDETCRCECHDAMYAEIGMRFEHGAVWYEDDDRYEYVREGEFPFLELPGEIRDKIYGYAFLQDGTRRDESTRCHRGSIHTALLGTSRQVYREAGHLPLSVNTINFSSPLYGLDFLGFSLVPKQKELVTSVHVEFDYADIPTPSWRLLIKHLAKMPITNLILTIKGRYSKDAFLGHKCFAQLFADMNGIESLDIVLCSKLLGTKAKEEIQEEMRETIIEGYKRPLKEKKKKRNATSETGDKKPVKKLKKATKVVSAINRVLVYTLVWG